MSHDLSKLPATPRSIDDPKANFRIGESKRANLTRVETPLEPRSILFEALVPDDIRLK